MWPVSFVEIETMLQKQYKVFQNSWTALYVSCVFHSGIPSKRLDVLSHTTPLFRCERSCNSSEIPYRLYMWPGCLAEIETIFRRLCGGSVSKHQQAPPMCAVLPSKTLSSSRHGVLQTAPLILLCKLQIHSGT
jgi:hypothetical protein